MKSNKTIILIVTLNFILISSCRIPHQNNRNAEITLPKNYYNQADSGNIAQMNWKNYFKDSFLVALIDSAISNNKEMNIFYLEIQIKQNEIRTKKGEYLPFIDMISATGIEKEGLYTRHGAVDEQLEIKDDTPFPKPLGDFNLRASASWEVDIWKKLRNSKKAAIANYFASVEGKNFLITNLVAEIAESYYELMALDNLLDIIEKNIKIQSNALSVVRLQKESAKVTQLAVNRFEAQLLNTINLQYAIKQQITEKENLVNFLTGKYSTKVLRNSATFSDITLDSIEAGIPAQLLSNRPDIRRAEFELSAANLNVQVARANFYPSLSIKAGIGFQAFNPTFLFNPESILYNLAGDLVAPLINRNAIIAEYKTANAKQLQAVFSYEQSILNAYVDVLNQLSKIDNFGLSFKTKQQEVDLLTQSIGIANNLFNSARADYTEVLLTQREALEAKMELMEIQMKRLNAKVNIYRALGGGWY